VPPAFVRIECRNKLLPALIACVALAPATVQAAGFEGHVAFKISSSRGQPQEMSYDIEGEKFRVEMPGQKGMGGMMKGMMPGMPGR
jgi:hypothetical protein